jgi:diguanylate cyclase (GGDEF)-like protein
VKQGMSQEPFISVQAVTQQVGATMHHLARRQWWLWVVGVAVILFLVVGIVSFLSPGLLSREANTEFYRLNLRTSVGGLIGLVAIFCVYIVHQQYQIYRGIDAQIRALSEFQERSEKIFKSTGRDRITNLYNNEIGKKRLSEEVLLAYRRKSDLTVLRMELGGIEEIGERLGVASEEHALRSFSEHLQRVVRNSDVPISIKKGEFLVLLPDCDASHTGIVWNRLSQFSFAFGDQQRTEVFGGFASYERGEKSHTLLMRAEGSLVENLRNRKVEITQVAVSLKGDNRISQLSPRERQVLDLLAQGKCNKEIASQLEISVRTAETHRANVMERLGVHSAQDLVLFAVKNKLVDAG